MIFRLGSRMLTEVHPRLIVKFAYTFGWKGMGAVRRFQKRVSRGEHFPAFLFLSITNRCNLRCQGCWVSRTDPPGDLPLETLNRIVEVGRSQGCYFYGLLGGEPLMHPDWAKFVGDNRDCYFQLFTNGSLLTDDVAKEMRRLGNVTPLISVEGNEKVSDIRRNGNDVYAKAMEALENARRHRLVTGVACSVCQSNINDLMTDDFARMLIDRGVMYLWYYIYRPVGPNPTPDLALSGKQIRDLRQFMVDLRCRMPIAVVDAYWDADGNALCPAVTGISHHINPFGDIEPCPVVQFAEENVGDGSGLFSTIADSAFLARFRDQVGDRTRGCILMDDPAFLNDFLKQTDARDTTGRGTGLEEVCNMCQRPSHDMGKDAIPEKHWAYRFAKKNWFFGFGAYG